MTIQRSARILRDGIIASVEKQVGLGRLAIRTATICHNDDDYRDPKHRRVKLLLVRDQDGRYLWRTPDEDDCGIPPQSTVLDAVRAAMHTWGAEEWDLRAGWNHL